MDRRNSIDIVPDGFFRVDILHHNYQHEDDLSIVKLKGEDPLIHHVNRDVKSNTWTGSNGITYLDSVLLREERNQQHRSAYSRYANEARSISAAVLKRLQRVRATRGEQPTGEGGGAVSGEMLDVSWGTGKIQAQ